MNGVASPARRFVCRACRQIHVAWAPRCSICLSLEGLDVSSVPEVEAAIVAERERSQPSESQDLSIQLLRPRLMIARAPEPELTDPNDELTDLDDSDDPTPVTDIVETTHQRDATGVAPLDHVLGGGLVIASVVLLASPPGCGKSSLTLQMLVGLKHRCLYVSGEETKEQIAATAYRIGAVSPQLLLLAERNLKKVFEKARKFRVNTIAIDSIQKMLCADVGGRAGSPGQVKECTDRLVAFAKLSNTTVWIIGHVTGDNNIAGPKTIEHDVDVVIELAPGPNFDGNERILRCPTNKNRFGPTNNVGRFEMTATGLVAVDADGWDEEGL